MRKSGRGLILSTSPFLTHSDDTSSIMWNVVFSLIPAVIGSVYFFGISALLVIVASVAGALLSEYYFNVSVKKGENTLKDGSAFITGLLLAFTLPPGIPLWMAFMGGMISIVIGKLIFGGLGFNPFNPALVGRAFLQAAFPVAMTTWSPVIKSGEFFSLRGDTFALPFLTPKFDAMSAATPLAQMKFEGKVTDLVDLFVGNISGTLGETSALLLLLGGVYLVFKNIVNWRLPVGIFGTTYLIAFVLHAIQLDKYPVLPPQYYLVSGGLMLGAIYMATDMVTCPITQKGMWIFGISIGALVMIIRIFGGLAEGVMYAILLMNAMSPLINNAVKSRVFGQQKPVKNKKS